MTLDAMPHSALVIAITASRIAGRAAETGSVGERAEDDQLCDLLRVLCSVGDRYRPTFGMSPDGEFVEPGVLNDGLHVTYSRFEREVADVPRRETAPPLVHLDPQVTVNVGLNAHSLAQLVVDVKVAYPAGNPDDRRAVARYRIGDTRPVERGAVADFAFHSSVRIPAEAAELQRLR